MTAAPRAMRQIVSDMETHILRVSDLIELISLAADGLGDEQGGAFKAGALAAKAEMDELHSLLGDAHLAARKN